MPTGIVWHKGHEGELLVFEESINGAGADQLREVARQMRLPGADFMDVYWRTFFSREPDELSFMISANWFGAHPDPALAGRPMWASNAAITPEQVHALARESFARTADWRADDVDNRRVAVWARSGEPEHRSWLLWPSDVDGGEHTGHLFMVTPFNAAYPATFTGTDPWGRPEPQPADRVAAAELLAALIQLTQLEAGDSIASHLEAASRVAVARTALPGADSNDDNELFGVLCRALPNAAPQTPPPFVGTGLAVRMGDGPVSTDAVSATAAVVTEPPGGDPFRSSELDAQWNDQPHEGIVLQVVT